MGLARGEVYLARLDPVLGHELGKTHPCVVMSPNEANAHAGTITVAPLSTQQLPYLARVSRLTLKRRLFRFKSPPRFDDQFVALVPS